MDIAVVIPVTRVTAAIKDHENTAFPQILLI